ncbi:MAG: FG-GAP repeat domain-containing protein [Promethearchaeota archaeon]
MWNKTNSYLVLGFTLFLAFVSFSQALKFSPVVAQSTDNANISHNFIELYTITSFPSSSGIAVGNCHPDGVSRIILGNYYNGTVRILLPSGASYIIEAELFLSPNSSDTFVPYLVYDFDEDGLPEILGNLQGHGVFIGWNGTGYSRKWETKGNIIYFYDGAPQVYDIDRDGDPELITNTRTSTFIYSWNSGFTNFQQDAVLSGGAWFDVGIGDIDRDGENEIITSSTPVLHVYGYNGGLYEEEYQRPYSNKDYAAFSVVDIDNDLELEIIGGLANVGGVPNYPITQFEWNGTGLDLYNITYSPSAHFDTHAGDVDGDGLPEVLLEGNGAQFTIVELASNGTIIAKDYSLSCNLFFRLFDFDEDYILEVVTATDRVYQDDIILPPALIDTPPSSITVEQNSLGHKVSWTPIDRQNLIYYLYWNSYPIAVEECFSGVPIVCSLDYRLESPSIHNLTVVVVDDDTNKVFHSVFITVVSPDVPAISNVEMSPVNPTAGENVTISVNITDRSGIFSADLYYQIDNTGWVVEALIWQFDDVYQAEIGPFMFGQEIMYYITAMDDTDDHNMVTDDNFGAYYSFKVEDTTEPMITNVYHFPSDPIEGDTLIIYADIEDESGIANVDAYIQINGGGWTSTAMEYQSGTTWRVNIGSFAADTKIEYYIQAYDASESKNEATNDNEGKYYSIYITPESTTEQTTTTTSETTSEKTTSSESSEESVISLNTPITLTGFEIVLLSLGVIFYRKYKYKK